jgi:hypothetical protein
LEKALSFEGYFWLPGREVDRQSGIMRVGPGVAPTIATTQPLISPWREVGRTDHGDGQATVTRAFAEEKLTTPVTIYGLDDGKRPLTLISAMTTHWGPPDAEGYTHKLRGIQAVIGGHMRDRDHPFTSFRVRLRNLEAWRPRQQDHETTEVALATGGSVTLEELPISGEASSPALWLTGRGLPPITLRNIGTYFVQPLISLFTLATDRPCPPLALQVSEEPPSSPWLDIYSAAVKADEDRSNLQWDLPRWLLQPADVGLEQIGSWLNKANLLGPLPAVVADLSQAQAISLDTQALLLATIAEGLHRRLYPDDLRFDDEKKLNAEIAERVQTTAAGAVESIHAGARAAVSGLLGHVGDIGYAKRLARLANVAETAALGVTGRTSRWKSLVSEVRNEYAHRISAGFLEDQDADNRLAVAFSLRWMLTAILLLESGVDASVLRTRLSAHEQYQRFLADAQVGCPRIFPPR